MLKNYLSRIYLFEDPTLENEEYTYLHRSSKLIDKVHYLIYICIMSFNFFAGLVVGLAFSDVSSGVLIAFWVIVSSITSGLSLIFNDIDNRAWKNGENMPLDAKIEKKKAHIQKFGFDSVEAFDEYVIREDFPNLKKIKKIKAKV